MLFQTFRYIFSMSCIKFIQNRTVQNVNKELHTSWLWASDPPAVAGCTTGLRHVPRFKSKMNFIPGLGVQR